MDPAAEREALTKEILDTDRRIYQAIQAGRADEWLRAELTMRQLKVLLLLDSGETGERHAASMSHLAAALHVTLPTVTGIVDRLVEHGFVRREEDPSDRRLVVVRLTPAGGDLLDRLRASGRSDLAAALDRLTVDELRIVARGLDLLLTAALARGEAGAGSGEAESRGQSQEECG